jgi:bacteriocin-like protein
VKTIDRKQLANVVGGKGSKGGSGGGPPTITAESNIQQLLASLKH